MTVTVPVKEAILPVLALPPGLVLFPRVTVRVPISSEDATTFIQHFNQSPAVQKSSAKLQKLLDLKNSTSDGSPASLVTVACIPRKPIPSASSDNSSQTKNDNVNPLSITPSPVNYKTKSISIGVREAEELHDFGTVARVVRLERTFNNSFQVVFEGLTRLKVIEFKNMGENAEANVEIYLEDPADSVASLNNDELQTVEALKSAAKELVETVISKGMPEGQTASINVNVNIRRPLLLRLSNVVNDTKTKKSAAFMIDLLSSILPFDFEEKISILETIDVIERCRKVTAIVNKRLDVSEILTP